MRGCWPGIDPVKAVQVFCYKGSDAHEEMRQACFDYLRLGGWYSAGPVSLLSGLNPRPSILVLHFFAVAVFGVGRLLLPRPTLRCSASLHLFMSGPGFEALRFVLRVVKGAAGLGASKNSLSNLTWLAGKLLR